MRAAALLLAVYGHLNAAYAQSTEVGRREGLIYGLHGGVSLSSQKGFFCIAESLVFQFGWGRIAGWSILAHIGETGLMTTAGDEPVSIVSVRRSVFGGISGRIGLGRRFGFSLSTGVGWESVAIELKDDVVIREHLVVPITLFVDVMILDRAWVPRVEIGGSWSQNMILLREPSTHDSGDFAGTIEGVIRLAWINPW
jgi:hypothetical protein